MYCQTGHLPPPLTKQLGNYLEKIHMLIAEVRGHLERAGMLVELARLCKHRNQLEHYAS